MSDKPQAFNIESKVVSGKFKDVFTGVDVDIIEDFEVELKPWGYLVLSN
jgi:hypothetical protein